MGEEIKRRRIAAGLSQKALAAKLGVAQSMVSCWETGENAPNIKNAVALAKIFGCTVDDLLGGDADG